MSYRQLSIDRDWKAGILIDCVKLPRDIIVLLLTFMQRSRRCAPVVITHPLDKRCWGINSANSTGTRPLA